MGVGVGLGLDGGAGAEKDMPVTRARFSEDEGRP